MLNARLYRTCWLVAGVALVVALLTLETPDTGPEPPLPSAIDGDAALEITNQLEAIAPGAAARIGARPGGLALDPGPARAGPRAPPGASRSRTSSPTRAASR